MNSISPVSGRHSLKLYQMTKMKGTTPRRMTPRTWGATKATPSQLFPSVRDRRRLRTALLSSTSEVRAVIRVSP